ncbi:GGDEF domain-containing protein [Chitinibacter tainanensis]|uniref:GGDEF domain-containing protein n=1 Tax=Chitinibacter tainanensis TaxID=230667 RepID=UPI0003F89C71|nr:GGDEF domain-containing protein [Chitinibacter tainanensis]
MQLGDFVYALTVALIGLGGWLYARHESVQQVRLQRYWLLACLCIAGGLCLEIAAEHLPAWTLALAISLITAGSLLQSHSLGLLLNPPQTLCRFNWSLLGVASSAELLASFGLLPARLSMLLTALTLATCFLLLSWRFWQHEQAFGRRWPGMLPLLGLLAASCFLFRAGRIALLSDSFSPLLEQFLFLIASTCNIMMSLGLNLLLLRQTNQALSRLAIQDALTGALNRRGLYDAVAALPAPTREPVSVALIDLDYFKQINDHYGHAVGDDILRQLVGHLQRTLRPHDLIARYGGEEFCVLLPGLDQTTASRLLDEIRATFASQSWSDTVPELRCSFSAGVSEWQTEQDPDSNFALADQRLYQAKAAGRNQIHPTPRGH